MTDIDHTRALVVFSGGQDSTTCLFWAKRHFREVAALTFTYGQKHAVEVEAARAIAEKAGVAWEAMDVPLVGALGHNALTDTSLLMDEEKPAAAPPNTFVPGRNLFFLSIAAVHARERGIRHIVTGVSETDYSGYPDCRDNTLKSLQVALSLGLDAPLVIETPLMWLDKGETWELAHELGGDALVELIRTETHTCYMGVHDVLHDWGYGCGECPACRLRARGWQEYLERRADAKS